MLSRLAKRVVLIMLVLVIGAHWTILQSVAWLGMVINYSREAPVSEALAKTFDGKHPCQICKLVKEGKASEQKRNVEKLVTKIDFFLQWAPSLLSPPPPFPRPVSLHSFSRAWLEAPPTPPPRPFLGC